MCYLSYWICIIYIDLNDVLQAKDATKKLEQAKKEAQLTREKLAESEKSAKEALRKVKI